jgi:hypothetical protein
MNAIASYLARSKRKAPAPSEPTFEAFAAATKRAMRVFGHMTDIYRNPTCKSNLAARDARSDGAPS